MSVQLATLSDYGSILAFYDDVIDRTPEIGRHAWWQKGKHPTAEGVRAYIEEGSMYLCRDDRAIIAVMALTPYQGADYHPVKWLRDLPDDEVAVIHILAVSPDRQGEVVGEQMVREAVRLAEEWERSPSVLTPFSPTPRPSGFTSDWGSSAEAVSISWQRIPAGRISCSMSMLKSFH